MRVSLPTNDTKVYTRYDAIIYLYGRRKNVIHRSLHSFLRGIKTIPNVIVSPAIPTRFVGAKIVDKTFILFEMQFVC